MSAHRGNRRRGEAGATSTLSGAACVTAAAKGAGADDDSRTPLEESRPGSAMGVLCGSSTAFASTGGPDGKKEFITSAPFLRLGSSQRPRKLA